MKQIKIPVDGWWVGKLMDVGKSCFKDCLQQYKNNFNYPSSLFTSFLIYTMV